MKKKGSTENIHLIEERESWKESNFGALRRLIKNKILKTDIKVVI